MRSRRGHIMFKYRASRETAPQEPQPDKGCIGCVIDGRDHTCGYVETPADLEYWKRDK